MPSWIGRDYDNSVASRSAQAGARLLIDKVCARTCESCAMQSKLAIGVLFFREYIGLRAWSVGWLFLRRIDDRIICASAVMDVGRD